MGTAPAPIASVCWIAAVVAAIRLSTVGRPGSAGLRLRDLIDLGGGVLRFGYTGQFSHRVDSQSALLEVSMPF